MGDGSKHIADIYAQAMELAPAEPEDDGDRDDIEPMPDSPFHGTEPGGPWDRGAGAGGDDGDGDRPHWRLPEEFPVRALGVHGKTCWFLDELGQLHDLAWKDIARANIEGLMGRKPDLLEAYWPRLDRNGRVTGWRPEDAGRALKATCAERGVWSPAERVRGAGSHNSDGDLIMHYGDRVVVYPADGSAPEPQDPGEIGPLVYPARPPLPRPATDREPMDGAGAAILADLRTWNWSRPDIDPVLMLGQMVAGILGGALKWRPLVWTPGGAGRGKSSLHEYVRGVLGHWVVSTSDTTGAGIWQKLGFDTRAVAIDELEGEEDNRRQLALIALARQAASGGVILRGGEAHEGKEFTAKSAMIFSSIGMPPLNAADRSRLAILELRELPPGAKPPDMGDRRLQLLGRKLLRRIVDQWPRYADTLQSYRAAMEQGGHSGRGRDVFGTLLACADLAIFDHPPDPDTRDLWSRRLAVGGLAELSGNLPIEYACLLYLLTQRLEAFRGGVTKTIGEWVKSASFFDALGQPDEEARTANTVLKTFGIEVKPAPLDKATREPKWPGLFLWVATRHTELARLFQRSKWQGGADTVGGWVQHLAWLPGTRSNVPFWAGVQTKAVLIPLDLCLKEWPDGGPEPDPDDPGEAMA